MLVLAVEAPTALLWPAAWQPKSLVLVRNEHLRTRSPEAKQAFENERAHDL